MICWADTETGGLKEKINPILSLGYVFTKDDSFEIIHENEIFIANKYNLECNPEALRVNKIDLDYHAEHSVDPKEAINIFREDLKRYFGRKRPVFGGHNFGFDLKFIEMMHERENEEFRYHWRYHDTAHFFRVLKFLGVINPDKVSMDNLMEYFRIKPHGQRHSALADVHDLLNVLRRCKRLRLLKAI